MLNEIASDYYIGYPCIVVFEKIDFLFDIPMKKDLNRTLVE